MTSKFPSCGNKVGMKSEVFGDKEQSEWISMNRESPHQIKSDSSIFNAIA